MARRANSPKEVTLELNGGIPDPGDVALSARCGGDLAAAAFESAAQVLRVIAGFPPQSVRVGLYLQFDPSRRREQRTRIRLVGRCLNASDSGSADAVRALLTAGPLQLAYGKLISAAPRDPVGSAWLKLADYCSCWRIHRRVEVQRVQAELREGNHRLDTLHTYSAVHPFKPRVDHGWLGLDQLLDGFAQPALIEVVVGPHDFTRLREAQFDYSYLLSQINAYDSPLDKHIAEDARRKLTADLQHDPQADYFSTINQDMVKSLRQPQVLFALRCWSASVAEGQMLASILAEECFEDGSYQLQSLASDSAGLSEVQAAAQRMQVLAPDPSELVAASYLGSERINENLPQLIVAAPCDQLASVFRLPVGRGASAPRTMVLHTDPPMSKTNSWTVEGKPTQDSSLLIGEDLEVASESLTDEVLKADPSLERYYKEPDTKRAEIRLERKLLQKHLFVCGVPGSGKTTAMFNFVVQLHFQDTPFLIIEPAKTEYRMFKRFGDHPDQKIRELAKKLRVYTLGEERISPLRFNPMIPGEDTSLEEHKGALMACFLATMPIDGPLEGILQEALTAVYENPPANRPPRLSDLVAAAKTELHAKGYDAEITSNLGAMLDVRLGLLTKGSLGKVLECDENIPSREVLFSEPVVLEMDTLSQSSACLITLLVLTALRQHLRWCRPSGSPLKHVVFLEEAHNIVGRATGGADDANQRSHAARYIANMLAEVRALGEGMIIADQLPSAVAPEVIKNTGSKLALRLVANDDREELGGTMLLDAAGIAELARCKIGSGFFYREGYYRPRRVQTLNAHALLSATRGTARSDGKPVEVEFEPPDRHLLTQLLATNSWFVEDRDRRELNVAIQTFGVWKELLKQAFDHAHNACEQTLTACEAWLAEFDDESLRKSLDTLRECTESGQALVADKCCEVTATLARLSSTTVSRSAFDRLTSAAQRLLVEGLMPTASAMERNRGVMESVSALLAVTPDDQSLESAVDRRGETAETPFVYSAVTASVGSWLIEDSKSINDRRRDLNTSVGGLGLELLPEIDWNCSDDEFSASFAAVKQAVASRLRATDTLALRLKEVGVATSFCAPDINPFLSLAAEFVDTFAAPYNELEIDRTTLVDGLRALAADLAVLGDNLRRMFAATGES